MSLCLEARCDVFCYDVVQFLELQSVHKSVTVNIEQVEVHKREVVKLTQTIETLNVELLGIKKEVCIHL